MSSVTDGESRIQLSDFSGWLSVLLAVAATVVLVGHRQVAPWAAAEPILFVGGATGIYLWLLVLTNASSRVRAGEQRRRLEVFRNRETLTADSIDIEPGAPVRLTYWPGWIVLALALGATATVRFVPSGLSWLTPADDLLLIAIVAAVVWLVAVAGIVNHVRARRSALRYRAEQRGKRLAVDALEDLPVMVSLCTPDGRRKHFNARFREVTGRDEQQLGGRNWLDCVHADDRPLFDDLFREDAKRAPKWLEVEYGMTAADGENRWVRERFVPRCGHKGRLVGYLAVGVDITTQVENEAENARELERLNKSVQEQREQIEQHKLEAARLNDELSKVARSRDRLQTKAASALDKVREAEKKLADARGEQAAAKADLKALKAEQQQIRTENRKLSQTLDKLQEQAEKQQGEEAQLHEQLGSSEKLLEQSKEAAAETRRIESQLRTKIKRLTTRSQELEEALEASRGAEAQAIREMDHYREAAATKAAEHQRELAGALRPQMDGVRQTIEQVRSGSLSDTELSELENAKASIASIALFLDGVLGKTPEADRCDNENSPDIRSFDLRAAVQSVSALLDLDTAAIGREVNLQCAVDEDFPPQVCGDSVHIREALLLLGRRAVEIADQGNISIHLSHDGTTSAHVAAKFEITHDTAQIEPERLRELFAVETAAVGLGEATDEQGRQPAVAWRLIKDMKGEFGLEARAEGGFVVWFTLPLPRRDTTVSAAPEPVAPAPIQIESPAEQRPTAAPRLPQEELNADLGQVRELGAQSIRLQAAKELEGLVPITILAGEGEKIELLTQVESCKKVAMRNYDVILRFTDMTEQQRQQILHIAMTHRPLTMPPIG